MQRNDPEISVIIIDDKVDVLNDFAAVIRRLGFLPRPFVKPDMALQSMNLEKPHLILLDIAMENISGYDICRNIKREVQLESIPVIYISVSDGVLDKVPAYGTGAVDIIQKPIQPEEVMAKVNTHIRLREYQLLLENANIELIDKLKISEEQFRKSFEQAPIGIAHLNPDGSFQMANTKMGEILGYKHKDFGKLNLNNLIWEEDKNKSNECMTRLLKGKHNSCGLEIRLIQKKGSIIWGSLTASTVKNQSGKIKYIIIVLEDVTEGKNAEASLRESEIRFNDISHSMGGGYGKSMPVGAIPSFPGK